ncbi:hypothetical protein [Methylobacterium radiodurans]|uniref:Uncharacterized protein n=1 Tax=Methylobacterium radiodurans TaxID=2202828 RepID=A0A2U8VTC8_9HYPH|nr:hypothetical protein [Methylobacterium radiodurans]AWN36376.1 hypothetical protein DK427_12090 [Methylobacterium radiodurans]
MSADIIADAAEAEIAFDFLNAVFQSVAAVMLDAMPAEGRDILQMLDREISTAARQIEQVRPDWARKGVVRGAEGRVCAILEALSREHGSIA